MATREDTVHTKRVRERIQTSQLITRLESNALGTLDNPMTSEQIQSARIVLAKSMPDLKAIDHTTGGEQLPTYTFHAPSESD